MESRLLHFGLNTRRSAGSLETGARHTTVERLASLRTAGDVMQKERLETFQKNPELILSEMIRKQGPAMIAQMQKTSTHYRTLIEGRENVQGIRSILSQDAISNGPGTFATELEEIMDAIVEIPEYDENTKPKHRYLNPKSIWNRDAPPRRVTYFETYYSQMRKDRENLETLKQIYPQHSAHFDTLQQAIGELERANPGYAAQQYYEGKYSFTDQAFKHFGKTAAFAGLSLAAIIFGTISIINRKFDMKFVIAAGLAALVGSASLRKMIMNGKFENDLAQVETATNDHILDLMETHGIKGDIWADLVGRLQEKDNADVKDALSALDKGKFSFIEQSATEELAAALLPGNTTEHRIARESLQQIMHSGEFPVLVRSVRVPRTPEGQQTIRDFVAAGSAKAAKDIRIMERAQQAAVSMPPADPTLPPLAL